MKLLVYEGQPQPGAGEAGLLAGLVATLSSSLGTLRPPQLPRLGWFATWAGCVRLRTCMCPLRPPGLAGRSSKVVTAAHLASADIVLTT